MYIYDRYWWIVYRYLCILSIDSERERVSLGIKQLIDEKFKEITEKYKVQDEIKCIITNVSEEGVSLKVDNLNIGLLKLTQKELKEALEKDLYKTQDEISCLVKSFDKKNILNGINLDIEKTFSHLER